MEFLFGLELAGVLGLLLLFHWEDFFGQTGRMFGNSIPVFRRE